MDAATNELYTKIGHYDKRIRPYEKGNPVGVKEKFFLSFMVLNNIKILYYKNTAMI